MLLTVTLSVRRYRPKRTKLEKFDLFMSLSRQRLIQILIRVGLLFVLLVTLEIPFVLRTRFSAVSQEALSRPPKLESEPFKKKKKSWSPRTWKRESPQLAPISSFPYTRPSWHSIDPPSTSFCPARTSPRSMSSSIPSSHSVLIFRAYTNPPVNSQSFNTAHMS
jgi:hypothetical protein